MKRGRQNTQCSAAHSGQLLCPSARSQSGLALLELLIVAALILILFVLYWGSGTESREHRQRTACRQNLQAIYMALKIYGDQQSGKFPVVAGAQTAAEALDVLVPRYTIDTSVFVCPASNDRPLPAGESFRKRRISYAYYMGRLEAGAPEVLMTDWQVDTLSKAAGQAVFSETGQAPGNNHGKTGGNLLFTDGHADWCQPRAPGSLAFTQGVVLLNPL
jgi:prepilin-type processing-associated H-X9-DG protein